MKMIESLTHYFSEAGRDERAEQKQRYNQAVTMMLPAVRKQVDNSLAGVIYGGLYGWDDKALRKTARSVLDQTANEIRQEHESAAVARQRAVGLVFLNEMRLEQGLPLDLSSVDRARRGLPPEPIAPPEPDVRSDDRELFYGANFIG
jgi:hypothetical protein